MFAILNFPSFAMVRFLPFVINSAFASLSTISPIPPDTCIDPERSGGELLLFRANITIANTNEIIGGWFELGLDNTLDKYYHSDRDLVFNRISSGPIVVDVGGNVERSWGRSLPWFKLAATPRSQFLNQVGSFVINPINQTNRQIVITPSNVTQYAYQGEIVYVENTNPDFWTVPISLGVVGEDPSTYLGPVDCQLSSAFGANVLPQAIYDRIYDRLRELRLLEVTSDSGMREDSSEEEADEMSGDEFDMQEVGEHLSDGDNDMDEVSSYDEEDRYGTFAPVYIKSTISQEDYALLPIIEFQVRDLTGNYNSITRLGPQDYIDMVDNENYRSVWLHLHIIEGTDDCRLNTNFLRNLLVHFDAINNRVGFADPINEF